MAHDVPARAHPEPVDQFRLKASPAFKAWLSSLAEATQLTMSDAVTQGLILLAEAKGFQPPPLRKPR